MAETSFPLVKEYSEKHFRTGKTNQILFLLLFFFETEVID